MSDHQPNPDRVPSPERCPNCDSPERKIEYRHIEDEGGGATVPICTDPWHLAEHPQSEERVWTIHVCQNCGVIDGDETELQPDLSLIHIRVEIPPIGPPCEDGKVERIKVIPEADHIRILGELARELEGRAKYDYTDRGDALREAAQLVRNWGSDRGVGGEEE